MPMLVFHQSQHYVNRNTFTLTPNSVNVERQRFVVRAKFNVPFESISDEPLEVSTRSDYPLRLLVVFGGIALVFFIASLFSGHFDGRTVWLLLIPISFASQFYFSKATYLVFDCGDRSLEFYKNRPTVEEVQRFIHAMQFQKQQYLRAKYSPIPGSDLVDSIRRLTWLKESGSINDEEFTKLKDELLKNLEKPRGPSGLTN